MADQMTPAEMRAAAKSALSEIHGQDPKRQYSVAEVKRIVCSILDANELLADVIEYAERERARIHRVPAASMYAQGEYDALTEIARIARGETEGAEV